ncbi:MAG: ADOP family duplicated permease [Candidatus Acidiferrales bacterium]
MNVIRLFRAWLLRLAGLFRKHRRDRELDAEIESNLALHIDDNLRAGMTPAEARRQALLKFGSVESAKESYRDRRGIPFLETTWQDVRFALRMLRKSPGFAVVAILTIALGIGSTSAVFSVVDRILFRSLPYPNAGRLVSLGYKAPLTSNEFILAMAYVQWRKTASPFADMGSMVPGVKKYDFTDQNPARVTLAEVDSHFLPTLGIRPILGRNFTPDECHPHAPHVALLSYGLWRSRYGGDPKVVGRSVSLEEVPTQVIGVLPADFEMPTLTRVDLLIPEVLDEAGMRRGEPQLVLRAFAVLKPGVTIAQSRAALQPLFEQDLKFVPAAFRNEIHLSVRSLRDRQMGDAKLASWVLLLAVLAVLLLASMNVANLLLARAAARQRETAVRVALGATPSRLARAALTESMLLSFMGAAAGCWIAYVLLRFFVSIAPQGIPRLQQATIDARVLLFTLAIALVSGLLFGMAPTWRAPAPEFLTGKASQTSRSLLRWVLVTAQIAVSLVLLTASGLLLRSLWKLQAVPLGMDAQNLITAEIELAHYKYTTGPEQIGFFDQLQKRLTQIPGIQSVALSDTIPPSGAEGQTIYAGIEVAGRARTPQGTGGMVGIREVSPDYFSTLEIKIPQGRAFDADDLFPTNNVIILSDALARKLFPTGNPLGKSIRWGQSDPWRTVVGVAADVRNNGLEHQSDPEFYIPWKDDSQVYTGYAHVIIRTPVNPDVVAKWIRSEVAAIDPAQPVTIQTMSQRVSRLADRPRFSAVLLALFAFMGVCLAAVGLYGVVAFLITQRTQEIGIRMALGATPLNVLKLVLGRVARWALAGVLAGLAGSWFATRLLRALLFQESVHDPWLFCAAAVLLVAIALLAAFIPARRAMRVDPVSAIRCE